MSVCTALLDHPAAVIGIEIFSNFCVQIRVF